jgi:putative transposase
LVEQVNYYGVKDITLVKLFCGLDSWTTEVGVIVIHFVQGHDHKYGQETVDSIPEKAIGVMDRGFASTEKIKELKQEENKAFVLRIKNNVSLEMLSNGNCLVGKEEREVEIRVVAFCDARKKNRISISNEFKRNRSKC